MSDESPPPSDPWRDWAHIAHGPWRHRLDVPGATLASETTGLEQAGERWTWIEDRVWRLPGGGLLLVRRSRSTSEAEDVLVVVPAPDGPGLVRAADLALGRTPGLVELLGRAGIEVGLLPDDQVEGDELLGPV